MLYGLSQIVNVLVKSGSDLIQSRNKSIAGIQNEKEDSVDVLVLGAGDRFFVVEFVVVVVVDVMIFVDEIFSLIDFLRCLL